MSGRRLRIVFVGETMRGSRTPQRLRAFRELGHAVAPVLTNRPGRTFEDSPTLAERLRHRLRRPRDEAGANAALVAAAGHGCDLIWVENARILAPQTLATAKRVLTVGFAIVIGTLIGAVAGFVGGWVDNLLMRLMDVLLAFPSLLLAIAIVTVIGPGLLNAQIAIGIVAIPIYARVMRASVLGLRDREPDRVEHREDRPRVEPEDPACRDARTEARHQAAHEPATIASIFAFRSR